MRKVSGIILLASLALAQRTPAQEKAPLKLIETPPLPGFSGDFEFGLGNAASVGFENDVGKTLVPFRREN